MTEEERLERSRASKRKWYHANKQKHRETQNAIGARNAEWFKQYKSTLSCTLCGETHPACLAFHHRDAEQKTKNIADMIYRHSIARILEEIAKCDVLCHNCHAKLHYGRLA